MTALNVSRWMAKEVAGRSDEGSPTRPGEAPATLKKVLDGLLEDVPTLIRQRALLPAFDWRHASTDQVERLLQRLAEARLTLPVWLAKGLLIAGHALPTEALRNCSPELLALAAVNAVNAASPLPESVGRQILDCALAGDMEAGVAAPLVARLLELSGPSLACRVALSQCRNSPEALRHVRMHLAAELETLPSLRLRLAGFSTTHGLGEALKPAFAAAGRRVEIDEANFGEVLPELLRPDETADALVVLLDPEFFAVGDWRGDAAQARTLLDQRLATLTGAIESYCRNRATPLLVNTLPASFAPTAGHIDRHHATGASAIIDHINRRLAEAAARLSTVHLVDADLALASVAPNRRSDPRLWYYGRFAYSDEATRALADAFAQVWQARERGPAKVLALDFDDTLWGGIYGDDGVEKLACGDDFPGNAFKALQQECLRLKAQGMLLVGLSKNNPDALNVFARHPGMALRSEDFAATAVNWEPKADNIKRLAAELKLGLDSIVFLDDSAHEREAMRRMCPGVIVPEMPADPARRPSWLRSLSCTWPLCLTEEDVRRSDMYVAERKGRELRETVNCYEDYLAGLDQKLIVEPLGLETLARAMQLHQRTNQFNLTTRRFNEADLLSFMDDATGNAAVLGRVVDKFGDHGIVLTACVRRDGATAKIESLVMSCRVIGRQIEAAFLGALIDHLVERGIEKIEAAYLATQKNGLVRDFYATQGFSALEPEGGGDLWSWQKGINEVPQSRFVTVQWRQQ